MKGLHGKQISRIFRSLNPTPLEDYFTKEKNNLQTSELDPILCHETGLIFLGTKLSPSESYQEYLYESKITVGLTDHFHDRATRLSDLYLNSKDGKIIDLGSNDGSFLKCFKHIGYKSLLGIEPAKKPSQSALNEGISTLNRFFDESLADDIAVSGKADLVTANYMFANVPDPITFLKSCKKIISRSGVIAIETGYHPLQFKRGMLDYIYHEHFYYYTLKSFNKLARFTGLKVINAVLNHHKGGSLEVEMMLDSQESTRPANKASIQRILEREDALAITTKEYADQVETIFANNLQKIRDLIKKKIGDGYKLYAFGASHSTTTLLYALGKEISDSVVMILDDNKAKALTYSPGLNIKVKPFESVQSDQSKKLILLLAWQHGESILKKHYGQIKDVEWLVPFPTTYLVS